MSLKGKCRDSIVLMIWTKLNEEWDMREEDDCWDCLVLCTAGKEHVSRRDLMMEESQKLLRKEKKRMQDRLPLTSSAFSKLVISSSPKTPFSN